MINRTIHRIATAVVGLAVGTGTAAAHVGTHAPGVEAHAHDLTTAIAVVVAAVIGYASWSHLRRRQQ